MEEEAFCLWIHLLILSLWNESMGRPGGELTRSLFVAACPWSKGSPAHQQQPSWLWMWMQKPVLAVVCFILESAHSRDYRIILVLFAGRRDFVRVWRSTLWESTIASAFFHHENVENDTNGRCTVPFQPDK